MSNNHHDLAPDRSSTERRETLSEKVPGLWTFIVLILLMVAMGVDRAFSGGALLLTSFIKAFSN
jgi:hypothetical protein